MWSSSPKKSEDPAEEAQADYHFQYVGKELHRRSEYLFSGDLQTVTKLALKLEMRGLCSLVFRVKKDCGEARGEVEYEWGWTIPTLLQFVLRASEFIIWSEVEERARRNQRLSVMEQNLDLKNFHEAGEYFVDKTKGESFTALPKEMPLLKVSLCF